MEGTMKQGCLVSLAVIGGLVVVIVVAVVIAAVIGGSKAVHDANKASKGGTESVQAVGSHAASNDVQIMSCGDGADGEGAPVVRITNHSSDPSNYLITVVVDSADGKTQIGTGNASADHLSAGQTTTADVFDMTQTIPAGAVCKLGDVTRYAS